MQQAGQHQYRRRLNRKPENMKSYKQGPHKTTGLDINKSKQGEPIERKIERILENKEPIKDGAPLIYTDRKEGIKAAYNVKTDRFEIAAQASDKIAKSYKARREESQKPKGSRAEDGGAESIQGKPDSGTDKAK